MRRSGNITSSSSRDKTRKKRISSASKPSSTKEGGRSRILKSLKSRLFSILIVLSLIAFPLTTTLLFVLTKQNGEGSSKASLDSEFLKKKLRKDDKRAPLQSPSTETKKSPCSSTAPQLEDTNLPDWMKSYFAWHHKTRCSETELSSISTKYLIAVCQKSQKQCGGLADRIKPLPYYFLYANMTNRILLITWEKPAPLETYLLPSQMNWTVPSFLHSSMPNLAHINTATDGKKHERSDKRILLTKFQTWDAGRLYFDEIAAPTKFEEIYHDLFRSVFTPSPELRSRIDAAMASLHLVPGTYAAAHVRARYPHGHIKKNDKNGGLQFEGNVKKSIVSWSTNAIRCAVKIFPNAQSIYFASDSNDTVKYMMSQTSPSFKNIPVVGLPWEEEPLHLDTNLYTKKTPQDFFPAFVDLFLLANARCVSFGMGGYGRLGQIMSFNSSCSFNHRNYRGRVMDCS